MYVCPMHPNVTDNKPGICSICGMSLEMKIHTSQTDSSEIKNMSLRLLTGILLTIPILLLTMGSHFTIINNYIALISPQTSAVIQFALATITVFGCGWPLLKRGWFSIVTIRFNMFTLITLSVCISYFYSVFAFLFPELFPALYKSSEGVVSIYFETASVITVLVIMGQLLELKGIQHTGSALRALFDLSPKKARRIKNNKEEKINLDKIMANDILRVLPGEKIPVDGIVIEGASSVDESMMTGESMPITKKIDCNVIGGTLNISHGLVIRAKSAYKDTMLMQIIHLVSEAQNSKTQIQRLADIIASYFVPIVLFIALITFVFWATLGPKPSMVYGLISAISVFIIACPCALGLATPMSIAVGLGRAANLGILIKDASVLEKFKKVDTLVIDKTGTLTIGSPFVTNIITIKALNPELLLKYAASIENYSTHPIAKSIIEEALSRNLELEKATDVSSIPGQGISGTIGRKKIFLGNELLLNSLSINNDVFKDQILKLQSESETIIYIVVDKKLSGFISISDPIKNSTREALAYFRKKNINIIMLTGDNITTAKAVANKLDIKNVKADLLPEQKNKIIKALQKQGHIVAMAGDGINDSPALAVADVSIAMGTGSDIAINSAQLILIKGNLTDIIHAHTLSKKVMLNIQENLFFAFIYNLLCIPIAAGVLYPWTHILLNPMLAALAMSFSSVSVIFNALRLKYI